MTPVAFESKLYGFMSVSLDVCWVKLRWDASRYRYKQLQTALVLDGETEVRVPPVAMAAYRDTGEYTIPH